jgi:hypothetical protein
MPVAVVVVMGMAVAVAVAMPMLVVGVAVRRAGRGVSVVGAIVAACVGVGVLSVQC